MKINKYSVKGTKVEDFSLPKEFVAKINLPLLAQARRVYEDLSHVGLRSAKTRAEVNRTGKKVYKQKGTGGARHGSKRAPIYVGGGVAHGPRAIERKLTLSDKMRLASKMAALNFKIAEDKVIILEGVNKIKKTKEAGILFSKLMAEGKAKKATLILSEENKKIAKLFSNLRNVKVFPFSTVNALNMLEGGCLVLDGDIFEAEKKSVKK